MVISSDLFKVEVSLSELVLLSSAVHYRLSCLKDEKPDAPVVSDYRKLDKEFNKILDPMLFNDGDDGVFETVDL